MKFIRVAKWCIFLLGVAWALFSANAFVFFGKAFPSSGPEKVDSVYLLASLQGYIIVFAPLIIGLFFLVIKWPERRFDKPRPNVISSGS